MKISTEVRFGVRLGLALCVFTVFMWLARFDSMYLQSGEYFNKIVILLPLIFTFLSISAKSKETKLTVLKRIQCGLITNFVAYLIHIPFLLFYHHFLNPDWLKFLLEFKEKQLFAQNALPEQIQTALENVKTMSSDLNLITNGFVAGVVIFGLVFSLLTLPFFRGGK